MSNVKNRSFQVVLSCVLTVLPVSVFAEENIYNQSNPLNRYSISAYENEYRWRDPEHDFRAPVDVDETSSDTALGINLASSGDFQTTEVNTESSYAAKEFEGEKFVDKIMGKIPYSKQLKSTWEVIDGDVDLLSVKGLRVDRGNKGIEYQTSTMPFLGEVEGVKFKAEAGEDNKLKFESSVVPFVGHVEGLKFKTSVGEESQVSVSYKISLDRLGL